MVTAAGEILAARFAMGFYLSRDSMISALRWVAGYPNQYLILFSDGRELMMRLSQGLQNSIAGLAWAARHETAFQQEIMVLGLALPASFFLTDSAWLRSALIASVLFVILVEAINTAIERLSDHVTPERHPMIKVVKDLGSAAVFIAMPWQPYLITAPSLLRTGMTANARSA